MRLDEKVGVRGEICDELARIGAREICGDGFFSSVIRKRIEAVVRIVHIVEVRRDSPRRASVGRLDLDDLGAEIREDFAR